MANPVSEIAGAIKAGFQLLASYKKNKHVTRLRAAVDAAETYILENERESPDARVLRKQKKRFFKYNQG